MLAYDYPLLGVFMTMLYFFLWVAWIVLLFRVIGDIFRSHDLGGVAKAFWAIFVIVLPFLGVFIYLVAHGRSMSDRDVAQAQAQDAAFQSDSAARPAPGRAVPPTSSRSLGSSRITVSSPSPSTTARRRSCWPDVAAPIRGEDRCGSKRDRVIAPPSHAAADDPAGRNFIRSG